MSTQKKFPTLLQYSIIFLVLIAVFAIGIFKITKGNTLGTDFYVFYLAGRYTFIENQNPYADKLGDEAQLAILGRPAENGEDRLGFAYPPYSLLAVLPLINIQFPWAQAIWMSFLIILLISIVYLCYPEAPPWLSLSLLIFYPFTFGVLLGNFVVPISGILIISLKFLFRDKDISKYVQIFLGIVFAWCTIKPQFVWLLLIFIILYAIREKFWWLVGSFFASLLSFIALSFLMIKSWPALWFEQLTKYSIYNQTEITYTFLLRHFLANDNLFIVVTILFGIILAVLTFWMFKLWFNKRVSWLQIISWIALLTYLIHPRGKSYEQIIYLLPILFWMLTSGNKAGKGKMIFWLGYIVYSWLIFVLSVSVNVPHLIIEWTIIPFLIWFIWFVLKGQSNPIKQPALIET